MHRWFGHELLVWLFFLCESLAATYHGVKELQNALRVGKNQREERALPRSQNPHLGGGKKKKKKIRCTYATLHTTRISILQPTKFCINGFHLFIYSPWYFFPLNNDNRPWIKQKWNNTPFIFLILALLLLNQLE